MPRRIVKKKVKSPRQGGSLIPVVTKTQRRFNVKGPKS